MTFTEFMAKYNGKYIDFDGVYGPQCVDLCRQYLIEVLQVSNDSIKPVVGAKDMYEKYDTLVDKTVFDRIPNTPTGVPEEGDIIIWGNSTYGHVAIFIEGDVNRFKSYDQNYPTGSPCHAQEHTYSNVLGWLRCKTDSVQKALDACRVARDNHWNSIVKICEVLNISTNVDLAIAEIKKLIEVDDKLVQSEKQVQEANVKIEDLTAKLSDLAFKQTELVTANGVLGEKVADYEKLITEQQTQISILKSELDELKKSIGEVRNGWELIRSGIKKLFGWG